MPSLSVTAASLEELVRLADPARRLDLAPQVARARQAGQYLSRLRGRGMEFEEARPYQPGDDPRNMDWRVTARIGKPYSKLFREERERPVLIGLDARAPMFFATRGRFKWARAQVAAALLAWAAFQSGDRVGGEIFARRDHLELRPRRGRASLLRFLKAMADRGPEAPGETASLADPLRRLRRTAHPGSLVVLASDFRGLDEAARQQLARLGRHNDVLLLQFYDRLEREAPEAGIYAMSDGRRQLVLETTASRVRERYGAAWQRRSSELEHFVRRHGMTWLQCATDEEPVERITRAFGRGRR